MATSAFGNVEIDDGWDVETPVPSLRAVESAPVASVTTTTYIGPAPVRPSAVPEPVEPELEEICIGVLGGGRPITARPEEASNQRPLPGVAPTVNDGAAAAASEQESTPEEPEPESARLAARVLEQADPSSLEARLASAVLRHNAPRGKRCPMENTDSASPRGVKVVPRCAPPPAQQPQAYPVPKLPLEPKIVVQPELAHPRSAPAKRPMPPLPRARQRRNVMPPTEAAPVIRRAAIAQAPVPHTESLPLPLPPPPHGLVTAGRRAATEPAIRELEEAFFAEGDALADQPVEPAESFDDLDDSVRPHSFWQRLLRR